MNYLSSQQLFVTNYRYPQIIDYNPLTKSVFKLGYWLYNNNGDRFARSPLIKNGKKIFLPKYFEKGIIDITLR
jgi:hypothetical protein